MFLNESGFRFRIAFENFFHICGVVTETPPCKSFVDSDLQQRIISAKPQIAALRTEGEINQACGLGSAREKRPLHVGVLRCSA